MPEATLSVRQLLELPDDGFPADVLRIGLPDEELKSLQNVLPGMPLSQLKAAVFGKLFQALEIDPITLLAGAWEKYSLLSDAAKQSKSGETVLVPLLEHSVTSELHPYVEIEVGPIKKPIEFLVSLSFKLKGVVLKIESEEIRGIEAGTCEGSGEIKFAGQSLWKHAIKPIPLPGKVKFGSGIRIR